MAKEAIHSLTKTEAREWVRYGITVNPVCPSAASAAGDERARQEPERRAEPMAHTPLGRLGDPYSDIGEADALLVSEGMRFLTGGSIMLDGGTTVLR